jgi:WhiB family redox-sensing transcriptional regulator
MKDREMTWRRQAACRDTDTGLFFPESDDDAAAALSLCAECPVRDACLEFALTTNQADGIWGGTTETERRRIRRRRRAAA